MPNMTLPEALELAIRHHEAGELEPAESIYRQLLAIHPTYAQAMHLLGVLLSSKGKPEEGIALVRKSIELEPNQQSWTNLGALLAGTGAVAEALAAHEKAIAIDPTFLPAQYNYASALNDIGRYEEGLVAYEKLLVKEPQSARALTGRGTALLGLRRMDESIAAYHAAVAADPNFADVYTNLSNVLPKRGRYAEALQAGKRAVSMRPFDPNAANNYATALQLTRHFDEAIAEYRRAIALKPTFVEAHFNLGGILQEQGHLDEAVTVYKRTLELRANMPEAHGNIGNALRDMGQLDDALTAYRKASALKGETQATHNFLFGLNFHPDYDAKQILDEHRRWNQIFAAPLAAEIKPLNNDRSPNRKLRIGIVSPDFNVHPVGRFLLPLLANRDHEQADVYCYSDVKYPDAFTDKLQQTADVWRITLGIDDAALTNMIRSDAIDILIDITMHAEGSRLLVFARKPAPVQATYLAYAGTTGLDTIDYRISDPFIDPAGSDVSVYSEKTARLAHSYWCYEPPAEASEIKPRTNRTNIRFGCFNNFAKISPICWQVWCDILRQVPSSELIVYSKEGAHRDRAIKTIEGHGIDRHRLQFVPGAPLKDYFPRYNDIDIALDPFPYPGGTTTCDALWMGVPVITLAGRTGVSRGGVSILANIGLPELISGNTAAYVKTAVQLANDPARIDALRSTLRDRMRQSPLMDAKLCASDFDNVLRQMWVLHCSGQ